MTIVTHIFALNIAVASFSVVMALHATSSISSKAQSNQQTSGEQSYISLRWLHGREDITGPLRDEEFHVVDCSYRANMFELIAIIPSG